MKKLTFNDHLDDMMERIMNEELTPDELEIEVKRSKALCQIADKKIVDRKIMLQAMKMLSNGDIDKNVIPKEFDELKQIENKG